MGTFQVKTPRTPEGAERRAQRTFERAIDLYQSNMELDDDGHIYSNTVNDKEEGIKVSVVPCYSRKGLAREGLAILDVEEYSSTSDQKHQLPTAKTTYLFDEQGNICEICYSDTRKFDQMVNPYYTIYDDKRLDRNLVDKFEEANLPINAGFLDSLVLSSSLYEYNPDVIKQDIEDIAYPTLLKTYAHQRLDELVDADEISDGLDGLDVVDLVEITDKISEMDDEQLEAFAQEEDELGD